MEREKGITNDGVHCEMKEDMRAFRQRAGSDASLEEWVKQSVWARGTGVDLERAMGATRPLCTTATVCLDDSDASLPIRLLPRHHCAEDDSTPRLCCGQVVSGWSCSRR